MLPLLISIALLIAPFILLDKKLFNVFFEAVKKDGPFSLQSQNRE